MATPRIPIPPGYQPPEGVPEGQRFKQLCTLRQAGKSLVVCAIGETELEDDEDFVGAVTRQMKEPDA